MTPQEAYNEAIRRLNEARDEYQARVADINLAQQTANGALDLAKVVDDRTQYISVVGGVTVIKSDVAIQLKNRQFTFQNNGDFVVYEIPAQKALYALSGTKPEVLQ